MSQHAPSPSSLALREPSLRELEQHDAFVGRHIGPNDAEIAQNEVFGPVLVVTPFDTEEEAIALANATDYGLGAYVHTRNLRRAHAVTKELQAGQIHVNGSGEAMQPNVPFGGWKHSGHGRLGGVEGLHDFLQPKNIWMNLAAED